MEWFIKANLNLAIFYFLYKLVLQFSGKHQLARVYLLLVPLVSLALPLMLEATSLSQAVPTVTLETFTVSGMALEERGFQLLSLAFLMQLYLTGVIISLLLTIFTLIQLWLNQSSIQTAYSFFKRIHIPASSTANTQMMLWHEEAHVKQWHSLDTIWYALVRAIFWINPFVYFLFRHLKEEHEYSADAYAISKLGDTTSYCELLLDETFGVSNISQLAHPFHSQISLLNRIKMITQTQPKSVAWWKRMVTLPLLGVLFALCLVHTKGVAQVSGDVLNMSEKMPSYVGGQEAMMQFLQDNIKYPKDAKEEEVEGRVILQFIVTKEGKVVEVTSIKKEIDNRLQQEGIRVIQSMPDWIPGEQDGKKVNVKFTLPIVFKLDPKRKK
jgi:TonB family protein